MNVEETIKKLLEKSDPSRNDSEQERTACYEKAVLLMKKHNLTLSDLSEEEVSYKKEFFKTKSKSRQRHQLEIALALSEFYPVKLVVNGIGQLYLLGQKCRVEEFFQLFYKLEKFYLDDVKKIQELFGDRHSKLVARKDYLVGFCNGVRSGLRYTMDKYSIVPVKDPNIDVKFPMGVKKIKALDVASAAVADAAYISGREAVLKKHLQ